MTSIFYAWSNTAGEIQCLDMGLRKRISIGADEIKSGPLALFMLQNNSVLPLSLFFNNFLPMSSWKHDFLYSCFLTCSVLYPNIILDEERMAKSLQESTITEILHFLFVVVLGLSSINMAFLLWETINLWKIFYSLVAEGCCMYHGQRERACTTLY